MTISADLILPAADAGTLREIASWDSLRLASYAASDFPVDVVRFAGSSSPPVVVSRARRAETLKAMPASLRERAQAAFARAAARPGRLPLAHGRTLDLSAGPLVMGVVNVTPDSFSDGGVHFDPARAVERALAMYGEGAAIVDVGGESTRPPLYGAAEELSVDEECARVLPVVAGIRSRSDAPISIDTRKAAVAREALRAGADLVNDVTGGRYDPALTGTVAEHGAGAILMHMKGTDPRRMQEDLRYGHLVADVAASLADSADRALAAGVPPGAIAVDPGLGFGKTLEGNLTLLRHLAAFRSLGFPVCVGASRKAFVRRFSGVPEDSAVADRLPGSLAALAAAAAGGAAILRVHDVPDSVRFLDMLQAIARAPSPAGEPVTTKAPAR
ncbi:MAG TPA: dihydropteroate synthase [Thermoanaerobaculia bacterium]